MKRCGNCRHYEPGPVEPGSLNGAAKGGQCRAHPPLAVAVPMQSVGGQSIGFTSGWPPVRAEHWCGEFKPTGD